MQSHSEGLRQILRMACAAGAFAAPAVSLGNPTGPELVQGTATFVTTGNTLTVTPSANAIIQWRSFSVAPGETVRFVQQPGSSVVNRVPGVVPSIAGQIESNGTVLFLNGSGLSGDGAIRDIAGIVDSSGRLKPAPASRRAAPRDDGPSRAVTLSGNRVFVIGSENVRRGRGRILLEPGRGAELGDVGIPYVRVYVEPPASTAVDLDSLVSRRPALGMFNALFAGRDLVRSESGMTEIATVPAAVEERLVIAFRAPVEDRAGVPVPAFSAPVEERPILAFRAPAEERVPAWISAPVEERSFVAMPLLPATVEERQVIVFSAPVESREVLHSPLIAAPVESRTVMAFNAPVEDRSVRLLVIQAAPVEERAVPAVKEMPESAVVTVLAAAEERRVPVATRGKPAESTRDLVLLARPVPAGQASVGPAEDAPPIRVAFAPSAVLPVAATPAPSSELVVRLPAVQRRLPRIMVDHRGAVFHL